MNEQASVLERLPSVAENRVRTTVVLMLLVVGILYYLARVPLPGPPPSAGLFGGDMTPGGGPGSGAVASGDLDDTAAAPVDAISLDDLAVKSGFGDVGPGPGAPPPALPTELPDLLRVLGELATAGDVEALVAVAKDRTAPRQARGIAISLLRNFGSRPVAVTTLADMVRSAGEAFQYREAALMSLVHIDGAVFDEFFMAACRGQLAAALPDAQLVQLLMLAAHADVTVYGGRTLRRLVPDLTRSGSGSRLARALSSFLLRLPDTVPDAVDQRGAQESDDPVVASNFLEYLRRTAATDPSSRSRLQDMATRNRSARIRAMAAGALRDIPSGS